MTISYKVFVTNILLVEDNTEQLEFLKQSLSSLGDEYYILEASSAKEAMQAALQHKIHLFFIDIGLPDGNGLELAKELRNVEKYALTWIVFLTTHAEYTLDAFQQTHCYDYIVKPYKADTVINLAQKLTKVITSSMKSQEKQSIPIAKNTI